MVRSCSCASETQKLTSYEKKYPNSSVKYCVTDVLIQVLYKCLHKLLLVIYY